jgi:hypothetical protein
MELTPIQRVVTFAVVVLVLAGLGVYLFLPKSSDGASAQPRSGPTPSHQPVSPTATGLTSSPPSGPSQSGHLPSTGNAPDIYNWLPFTPSSLASAARVTTTFAADYATYSYRQNTASYLAPMKPLITGQLADLLGRAYSAPGLVAARINGKQVSVGSAVINSLRAFGPSSITFVVTLTERTNGTKGPSRQTAGYAITVTGSGSSWQVDNIELESAGNQ